MITNTGKTIIAKYLIGQAPAYASHIAVGVGARPLETSDSFGDYSEKQTLDFEAFRTPITSRGYVYDEAGNSNIVFSAELPSDQRYAFTEIGVYSARSNPAAGSLDSKILYTFAESENWEYHTETIASGIVTVTSPLDANASAGVIDNVVDDSGNPLVVFRTNAANEIFNDDVRRGTYEQPRFLNTAMIIPGNMSQLVLDGDRLVLDTAPPGEYYGSHIHLTGISPSFNLNSSEDELRLAFSVLDKESGQAAVPDKARILIEFASSDSINPENYARFEADVSVSETNRYSVVSKKLGDLIKSTAFTWNTINSIKIYVTVTESGSETASDNFYVALDGLRLENLTSQNPLYGMSAYSVVKTDDSLPIVKEANSSNIVEFRFGMDVL